MRSKALGIEETPKHPVSSPKKSVDKENKRSESNPRITDVTRKNISSPRKSTTTEVTRVSSNSRTPSRTVSSKSKDDADVAVDINITSNQNVQVRKIYIRKQSQRLPFDLFCNSFTG
jgi:hypothetical protein